MLWPGRVVTRSVLLAGYPFSQVLLDAARQSEAPRGPSELLCGLQPRPQRPCSKPTSPSPKSQQCCIRVTAVPSMSQDSFNLCSIHPVIL